MSKYDAFWQSINDTIADLIEEAYIHGRSRVINISDLCKYGKRNNWYGSITMSKNGIITSCRASRTSRHQL